MSQRTFADRAEKQRAYRERVKEKQSQLPTLPVEKRVLVPLETFTDRMERVQHLETSDDKLLGDLLVTYGLNFIYADKGVGKTTFIMHLMLQWAKEPPQPTQSDLFFNKHLICGQFKGPKRKQKILFCDYELTDHDYKRRNIECSDAIEICIHPPLNEIVERWHQDRYNIIVIDNISCLVENLNSAVEVKRVLNPLKAISHQCTLIILAHKPFEKDKMFGSKVFEIMASSIVAIYKYGTYYCLRQEKSRDFTVYEKTDAVIIDSQFRYQSVLSTKLLQWGNLNILYNSYVSLKKELEANGNHYLDAGKLYFLKLKEVEVILELGEILYCNQKDYQFLMKTTVLLEPNQEVVEAF